MKLYLQFGYGMMGLSEHMINAWGSGVVILSPRDLKYSQMQQFSSKVNNQGGDVVFDPQFYVPHSGHDKLTAHSYWPNNYQTAWFSDEEIGRMLVTLKNEYNDPFETLFFILPTIRTSEINDYWVSINAMVLEAAARHQVHERIYATLCLSNEVLRAEDQIHLALEYIEDWEVDGCYIVPEPPNNSYLVNDPIWLINLLDLLAGLKLQGKQVVVGYSSHQMQCFALAKTDAIAAGNWLNTRSFKPAKFNAPEENGGRRSTWYYCPQALSEYQIPFLDIAQRIGALDDLQAPTTFSSPYIEALFSGAQPSTTSFGESESFRHYLHCLKIQTEQAVKSTYAETREGLRMQLETARLLTENLNRSGVRGRERDFSDVVDVNLASIAAFDRLRGTVHAHKWETL